MRCIFASQREHGFMLPCFPLVFIKKYKQKKWYLKKRYHF